MSAKYCNGITTKYLRPMNLSIPHYINQRLQLVRPGFKLDKALPFGMLFAFVWHNGWNWLRGLKAALRGLSFGTLLLGKGVQFRFASRIKLGKWNRLEEGVLLSALGKGNIRLGNQVRIGAYSRLITSTSLGQLGSFIHLGNHVGIGEFAYLGGAGGLTIGDDCIIGQYFSCHPENHNYKNTQQLIRLQGVNRQGIHIGNNCWIGAKVTVLDGVTIGEGCVIAAGSVVTKNIPSFSVAGGVPVRIIKRIETTKVIS